MSFRKLVPRGRPGYLEGREPQVEKSKKSKLLYFWGGGEGEGEETSRPARRTRRLTCSSFALDFRLDLPVSDPWVMYQDPIPKPRLEPRLKPRLEPKLKPGPGENLFKNQNFDVFEIFDFLDPASTLEVSDMALLIPEVWDFYRLSHACFFSIIIHRFFIDFSLLSSPCYSQNSPGVPTDRKKNDFSWKFHIFQYFAYKLIMDRLNHSGTLKVL